MSEERLIKLNIGCGGMLIGGFINIDKFYTKEQLFSRSGFFKSVYIEPEAEYLQADVLKLPFNDDYADYIESIDMIEHLGFRETLPALKEMRRVLKTGKKLKLVTQNFDDLARLWMQQVYNRPIDFNDTNNPYYDLMQVIYGNQQAEGEYHRTPINPGFIHALLLTAGFEAKNIEILIYPKGTPCDQPDLETNGKSNSSKREELSRIGMRTEMLVITATK